jgi:hypothetical protein
MKDLVERRQKTKAMMYKKLWWCILASIIVIFGFFFLNSFAFAGQNAANFVPDHWKTRWFVLDGWLNIVYLFDIAFIAYLWRPTANNRRFAMSDEVRNFLFKQTSFTNIPPSLLKTTTASKFALLQTRSMKKMLLALMTTSLSTTNMRGSCRRCHRNLFSPRHSNANPWMARPSLPWATKTEISSATTRTTLSASPLKKEEGSLADGVLELRHLSTQDLLVS